MPTLRFVGVAHIHVPGFVNMLTRHGDVTVAAVWDDEPQRRNHWAAATGARAATSVDDAIRAADAVVITSQTDAHAPLVERVAAAGKAVFVEKPLGLGAADAAAMARTIDAAGVLFQTGYFMRSDPVIRAIKTLVDDGAFGRISKAFASNAHGGALGDWFRAKPDAPHEDWQWMADPTRSGVGGFGDLGTHALDVLLWWLGDVNSVTAHIDNVTHAYGCDDGGQGLLRFEGGATATLNAGWADVANPVRFMLSGTKAHASVIGGKLYVTRDGKLDLTRPETGLPPAAPHAFELFLQAIGGKTPTVPLVTAAEAAYRSAVMEAMYEGAKRHTWVTPGK